MLALLIPPVASATTMPPLPTRMAALGDSITRAADVCCWYGDHPADSWSTGDTPHDGVYSHYERLVALKPGLAGHEYNDAVSGAKAIDLSAQVSAALPQNPGYVTLLIGANDLCATSTDTMTSRESFTQAVRAALAALHQSLPDARIFVGSIPNIYQMWWVQRGSWWARHVWSVAGICQSMLASTGTEALRQQVVAREEAFNQSLSQGCAQYTQCRWDAYATYNYKLSASQISRLDYFHPNLAGQAALAQVTYQASWWASEVRADRG